MNKLNEDIEATMKFIDGKEVPLGSSEAAEMIKEKIVKPIFERKLKLTPDDDPHQEKTEFKLAVEMMMQTAGEHEEYKRASKYVRKYLKKYKDEEKFKLDVGKYVVIGLWIDIPEKTIEAKKTPATKKLAFTIEQKGTQ